ncbi:MAG: biotin-dependent carboxyltransferase family protein [Marinomonas sp.]
MAFKVIKSGMLALIQDLGRYGYLAAGLTTGGPMDEMAFRWANALLKNDPNAAQIEITFGLFALEAQQATSIAITGADLAATLNDQPILPWQTYAIKTGDILCFNKPIWGLRAYLAVKDGITCKATLGSSATVMREQLGGLTGQGKKLEKEDLIPYRETHQHQQMRTPRQAIPNYGQRDIPVILSYQATSFSDTDKATFFTAEYTVSNHCDRMGYRMEGAGIGQNMPGITSEGIAYGAIQIPQDGQPIVLLRDRQTIGGYPKIGCTTPYGGSILSQQKPGDRIQFIQTTVEKAMLERQQQMKQLTLL